MCGSEPVQTAPGLHRCGLSVPRFSPEVGPSPISNTRYNEVMVGRSRRTEHELVYPHTATGGGGPVVQVNETTLAWDTRDHASPQGPGFVTPRLPQRDYLAELITCGLADPFRREVDQTSFYRLARRAPPHAVEDQPSSRTGKAIRTPSRTP